MGKHHDKEKIAAMIVALERAALDRGAEVTPGDLPRSVPMK